MFALARRVRYFFTRDRFESELAEEIEFHRVMKRQELVASGVEPAQAEQASRRLMGSVALSADEARDVWQPRWLQGAGQDVRAALRGCRASPIVSSVAVLSLGLGIGANSSIFSIINALLLRPLPVADPARLTVLSGRASPNQRWTYPIWSALRQHETAFAGMAAWNAFPFNLAEGGEVQTASGMFVSGGFFATLGVRAQIGRTITEADDTRDRGLDGAVAVISDTFWESRFHRSPAAVGSRLVVERLPVTIVGVTPPEFFGPEVGRRFEVALPIEAERLMRGPDSRLDIRVDFSWHVLVRLKPEQSRQAAVAALRVLQPRIRDAAMPPGTARQQEQFLDGPFDLTPAAAGISEIRPRYERELVTILAVTALVLLIACGNLANLLLAKAAARRHELSARVALGSSRWRLARQFLIESLLLATAGALVGLVLAFWTSRALVAQLSTPTSPIVLDLSLDSSVLAFTIAITTMTAILFGIAPAWRASRESPIDALKSAGRSSADRGHMRAASSLVVLQVALSMLLVAAAGLFVSTFTRLARRDTGLDIDRLLVVNVNANRVRTDRASRIDLYERLSEALARVPGAASAAASVTTPLNGSVWGGNRVDVPGAPPLSARDSTALINFITPGWFATYGVAVLAGRDLDVHDTAGGQPVAIVNESFARRFFPGRTAVGQSLVQPESGHSKVIVGVVADSLFANVRETVRPMIYMPLRQFDWPNMPLPGISLSVRTTAAPMSLARGVSEALTSINPELAFNFRPVAAQVSASLVQERLVAALSGFFGVLALLLAGLGLYGVTTCTVARQRSELGIRMALGSSRRRIVKLVLRRIALLVGIGVVAGVVSSVWAAALVTALLDDTDARDPVMLAGAAALLGVTAMLAAGVPTWRASRIDPSAVLREQ